MVMPQPYETLVWLHGAPQATGALKSTPEDFVVSEDLGFEPDGDGEHLLVRVRKRGCNTQFVADALAKYARVSARAVSYAGLKDRHAVTEQWFCLHLPGKDTPDVSGFALDGCEILAAARHRRKLRIGALRGNHFTVTLRQVSDRASVDARLQAIAAGGVPNYFGSQRFGRQGNNLLQAERWARNDIVVKERSKRSFYLSASRSALFNQVVSRRLAQRLEKAVLTGDALQLSGRGSWFTAPAAELPQLQTRVDDGELRITAPLPGDGAWGTEDDALAFEQHSLEGQDVLLALLRRERVEAARRAVLLYPQRMTWQWRGADLVVVSFWLPAGSFATSVLREAIVPLPGMDVGGE